MGWCLHTSSKALGIKENLKNMPNGQVFMGAMEQKREETHGELSHKALVEAKEKVVELSPTKGGGKNKRKLEKW